MRRRIESAAGYIEMKTGQHVYCRSVDSHIHSWTTRRCVLALYIAATTVVLPVRAMMSQLGASRALDRLSVSYPNHIRPSSDEAKPTT